MVGALTTPGAAILGRQQAQPPASPQPAPPQPAPAQTAAPTPASGAAQQPPAPPAEPEPPLALGVSLYTQYCATCHGPNGEGHVAERANVLRSRSFLASASDTFLDQAIRYGRPGTAMSAYHKVVGGPLVDRDIRALVRHVRGLADVPPFKPDTYPKGDAERGAPIYRERCESCHGPNGGGLKAPTLNDPLFLLTSGPSFVRYAIAEGREGSEMPSFRDTLTPQQIADVTTFVGTWRKQWVEPAPVTLTTMHLGESVMNPRGAPPEFGELREGRYVAPALLKKALEGKARMLLLDARPTSAWADGHIPGAAPFPYYDIKEKAAEVPTDGTWIVAYCACPTHLSNALVDALREKGFTHTAVLDEGLPGWMARRYPLQAGVAKTPEPASSKP
jgi:mono/diheme cytochrome c family protein/rhodanese-related sulfurtransferase